MALIVPAFSYKEDKFLHIKKEIKQCFSFVYHKKTRNLELETRNFLLPLHHNIY